MPYAWIIGYSPPFHLRCWQPTLAPNEFFFPLPSYYTTTEWYVFFPTTIHDSPVAWSCLQPTSHVTGSLVGLPGCQPPTTNTNPPPFLPLPPTSHGDSLVGRLRPGFQLPSSTLLLASICCPSPPMTSTVAWLPAAALYHQRVTTTRWLVV